MKWLQEVSLLADRLWVHYRIFDLLSYSLNYQWAQHQFLTGAAHPLSK